MEQPNTAPYESSPYPTMMDLPSSHMQFRSASTGVTTPHSRPSFDDNSYFGTVPQEIPNFQVSRTAESSLDPWFMDMPGTASPDSSRMSMSPSQGIATPPPDGFYSPSYPEHLQLPAYELLEQPRPLRSCSTSHPNWVSNGDNWERTYVESDIWGAQPFVAQPWVPSTYDNYALHTTQSSDAHANKSVLGPVTFTAENKFLLPESTQTRATTGFRTGLDNNDALSSEDESDWDDDESDYSRPECSTSRSKQKTKAPCVRQDRWLIPTGIVQQPETRGYPCNIAGCTTAFVRPEHLRRHFKSKHSGVKEYVCVVPGCNTSPFSRGDNLRDHYWTHLHRGGRSGKNRKFTLPELKVILGPKERRLIKKLKQKLHHHQVKEKLKKDQRPVQPAYTVRSML